ncbi:WD40 repeat domain-containing protein [Chloropicon primus]|uniref:WD40 repeat domain-containing protein n=1 Tax=Chloropicon primus TaxID=1764295 RepID=A0A5B8MV33_9CHLO|nr:WD40 repeat domain-containing protein [Chloropicon primus]UPR03355.1 WD40 repeat domain-containing protein [Chloropicon primus]|eukprot:QDZ24146.1 WD40 repeat domain-containing protein [Chloropicon primus]
MQDIMEKISQKAEDQSPEAQQRKASMVIDEEAPKVGGNATQRTEKKKMAGRRASLIPGDLHLPKKGKALEQKIKSGQVARLNLETEEKDEIRDEVEKEAQLFTARRGHRRSIMMTASDFRRNQDADEERYIAKNASFHINTLIDLKKAFDQADEDGSGALDEEEFVNAFRNVKGIKGYKTEEQLCHLFMKIDANSDGTVDWDEFTNHILLEQSRYMATEDEELAQALYEDDDDKVKESGEPVDGEKKKRNERHRGRGDSSSMKKLDRLKAMQTTNERIETKAHLQHLDMIEKIEWLPQLKSYISAGRDGLLKLWSDKLAPQRTIRNGKGWITDIALMSSQPMAVCSNERTISFYDSYRTSLDELGRIVNLDNVPLWCEYIRQSDHDLFLYADEMGFIYNYVLEDQWGADTTGPSAEVEVGSKKLQGMRLTGPIQVHNDWITMFKQQSQSTTLDLITSSMDCYVKLFDLEKRETKWQVLAHTRGVYGFDVCKAFNFIATCGVERDIMLWNPFTGRSIGMLTGHTASVQKVIVVEDDNQLISLSTDKCIKIWDLRTNKCMQTIVDKEHYWPENKITSLMFNPVKKCIVSGAVKLKERHRIKKSNLQASNPLVFGLFNWNFGQVVTGDAHCTVNVYNVETGEKVFAFDDVHQNSTLSAWSFDNSGRRLLTGGQDGTLKMWNFNNGQCLKVFNGFGEDEITCVAYVQEGSNKYVAAGGWNSKVCIWEDNHQNKAKVLRRLEGHVDDISCMCFCPISTAAVILATGGYDGEIVLWKLDGIMKGRLNPPKDEDDDLSPKNLERLIFIPEKSNMLLALRNDGKFFVWNVVNASLEHSLKLGHKKKAMLRSMCIDDECGMLFTADSMGYVIAWSFGDFEGDSDQLLRHQFCFRAHEKVVVAVEYVPKYSLILTASTDGRSRLWTANGVKIGEFGQSRPWQMHRWHTYAQRQPDHVEIDQWADESDEEEADSQSDIDMEVVALKDDNYDDDYDEGAYYLEQQRMNFFGVGRKDKAMSRRKKNTNFDLVLQRRLPLKNLSPIEPPKSYREPGGSRSKQASRK